VCIFVYKPDEIFGDTYRETSGIRELLERGFGDDTSRGGGGARELLERGFGDDTSRGGGGTREGL